MKSIRRGVFETNSSSCHSISICGGTYVVDCLPVDNGVLNIYMGEFGWEVESYKDSATKASYCYTYAKDNPENMKMLEKVLLENTDAKSVVFHDDYGYIDHQSSDVCGEAFNSEQELKNFIFNRQSTLHTDNDNH